MKYSINLLTEKETPFAERIMYFFLNYLRYIIIITQLVVIGVFFYRFQIDQSIIDLKDSVDQKKEIVQVVVPLLREAENIDMRTVESQKIFDEQNKFHLMLQYFLSEFPAGINLVSMEVSPDSVQAVGTTTQPQQLQAFYTLLKQENKFANINLQSLKKTDFGYTFTLILQKFKNKSS